MNPRTRAASLLGAGISVLGLASGPARAEQASDTLMVEELVVTAQKREENLQDVPIAVTALSGQALEARGVTSPVDLQFLVPNASFGRGTAGQGDATIRGVGAVNPSVGGDPGIAIYVDGHYLQDPGYLTQDYYDIARIEVLRGPQGTLYGRNAVGGAINIVTNRPTDSFEANVTAQAGNYSALRVQGMVSGPIAEGLSGRLAVVRDYHDGYTVNVTRNERLDKADSFSVRGALLFRPSTAVEVLASAYSYEQDSDVPVTVLNPYPTAATLVFVANPYLAPGVGQNPTVDDRRIIEAAQATDTTSNASGGAFDVTWRISDDLTLRSLSAYNESEIFYDQAPSGSARVFERQVVTFDYETFSQELQLVYSTQRVNAVAGLYFFKEDSAVSFFLRTFPFFAPPPATSFFDIGAENSAKSYAAFGQVDWQVRDRLEVTFGARYTRDRKAYLQNQSIPDLGVSVVDLRSADTFENVSGKLGVNYHITDDVMAYASYATGYKSGGFNTAGIQPAYKPEKVKAAEVGLKSSWLQRRLVVNAALFHADYTDKQEYQINGFGVSTLTNAGAATMKGAELELTARPLKGLQLEAQVSYLDAEYDAFLTVDELNPQLGVQDFAGRRLTRAPEWKVNLGAQYRWTLPGGSSLTARADHAWVDEQYFRGANDPRDLEPSYHRTNLRLTWLARNGRTSVQAYVNNLENDDIVETKILTAGFLGPNYNGMILPPRTFGLRVGVDF